MLSVLARLGQDPWVEAARWAKLSKAAAAERLVASIAGFPVAPQTGSDPRKLAARLVMLLPAPEWRPELKSGPLQRKTAARALGASLGATALPRWLPMLVLACALILGVALNVVHAPGRNSVSPAITQTGTQAPTAKPR